MNDALLAGTNFKTPTSTLSTLLDSHRLDYAARFRTRGFLVSLPWP